MMENGRKESKMDMVILFNTFFLGKENYPDGSIYEGLYLEGKKNGIGKIVLSNGYSYEGEFKDDQIEGKVYKHPIIFRVPSNGQKLKLILEVGNLIVFQGLDALEKAINFLKVKINSV